MNDYLAKPIDEEKLHSLLLRYKPGHIGGTYTISAESPEISVNQNATFDWQLALRRSRQSRSGPRYAANAGGLPA